MSPFIKICGITNENDAMQCVHLGVHFLGFIFAQSPRRVSAEIAADIISKLPNKVKTVAVFKNNPIDYVLGILQQCKFDLVQLHGNEGIGYINLLKKPIIKGFDMHEEDIAAKVSKYRGAIPLLDLPKETEAEIPFDIAVRIANRQPIMIAGKITIDNINEVIKKIKPMTVDICSGVEKEPGIKDHDLLEKMMTAIRSFS
ncbi:MAG: hypothetical protein A2Y62_05770 [Candidatus Fischerbacteria bacterium RBG_13_37_8]|uniref:N-(5'-phosphoribosyl)anthranilate isomerase n=1 Tax=Candidatus Fischerbacteria bacterium RBG_13_37_8 TaxID=1817863 RepID=A0A1F5VEM6_9BACT|nr:MAG: hypothetical protein A2Y62_05770 [Candidatus Fischerbacteria bacterium RBG_13_37_8]